MGTGSDEAVCVLLGEWPIRRVFQEQKLGCSMYDGLGRKLLQSSR